MKSEADLLRTLEPGLFGAATNTRLSGRFKDRGGSLHGGLFAGPDEPQGRQSWAQLAATSASRGLFPSHARLQGNVSINLTQTRLEYWLDVCRAKVSRPFKFWKKNANLLSSISGCEQYCAPAWMKVTAAPELFTSCYTNNISLTHRFVQWAHKLLKYFQTLSQVLNQFCRAVFTNQTAQLSYLLKLARESTQAAHLSQHY